MRIFLISPIGKSNPTLFPSFVETFESDGHSFVTDILDADTAFIDMFSGLGNYYQREIDVVLSKRMNVAFFDESDYGGCKDETAEWFGLKEPANYQDLPQWQDIFWRISGWCKWAYFMRKMDKTKKFPPNIFPYELNLYEDCILDSVTEKELFDRHYDICFIGNISPTRIHAMNGLVAFGKFKMDFHWTNIDGKIPHNEWMNRHRNSKLFLEACGGGIGSERPHQLMTTAGMLRVSNDQLVKHNFRHGIDCIEISEHPTEQELDYLAEVLSNKELLHQIYMNGITRLKKYFNKTYRANYFLETLINNGIK